MPRISSGFRPRRPIRSREARSTGHLRVDRFPGSRGIEAAISVASLTELHFGTLLAADADERARRAQRLGVIEATFDPLPVDSPVAREWGRLAAAVAERGAKPRRRAIDLAIAATANVHDLPLLTADTADLAMIEDLVQIQPFR